jgi:thiamine transport system substrate-binding protein
MVVMVRRIVGLALCGLFVMGCSSGTPEVAEPGDTVRLLAHDSFLLSEDVLASFTQATGIDVEVLSGGDAGSMVAGAVLAAGAPTADVLFGADNTLVQKAIDAGVFEPYTAIGRDQIIPAIASYLDTDAVTPIDFGDVCINIDDAWFARTGIAPPTSLEELTTPTYRDLLVVQDPATSSPGLAFLLATISRFGDSWTDYWSALRDNGVKVAGSWTDAYYSDFTPAGGDRPLVVSYATSPPAEIVFAEGTPPTRPSTSVLTDGCYRQIEYAGVLAGALNPQGARLLIDWLLSTPVQEDIPLNMFVFPARSDAALPQVFTDFAAQVEDPEQIPAQEIAGNLDDWLARWGEILGR